MGERNILFIQTGQQQVLIETGIGRDLVPGSMPGVLWDRLTEAGISPDEIDLVLFSHADIDHIGGAVAESGKAAFPHAWHILLEEEAAFWFAKPMRLRPSGIEGDFLTEELCRICNSVPPERLAQLHDQLKRVSAETEVTPGIRISAAPGHTPGHAAITMASGADRLLFIGDLLYAPQDIEDPHWYSPLDFDPPQAIATRQRIFAQAARERTLLLAYHLPFPGLGYVTPHGAGWRWTPFEAPR